MKIQILLIAFLALAISSCNKRKKCVGGSNGKATIKANVKYHNLPNAGQATYLDTDI